MLKYPFGLPPLQVFEINYFAIHQMAQIIPSPNADAVIGLFVYLLGASYLSSLIIFYASPISTKIYFVMTSA